jgi:hypothetical protein
VQAAAANSKQKIKAATAQEIGSQCPLSDDGKAELKPEMPPVAFIDALAGKGLHVDAFHFLARALPKREAVWWACLCARTLTPDTAKPEMVAALRTAEAWVFKPSEENRRAAEKAAKATQDPHPARWSAMAAFWSGGSMAPPDGPEVKPAEDLTAKAVAAAVVLAAGLEPAQSETRNKQFIECGLDIAAGGKGRPLAKG